MHTIALIPMFTLDYSSRHSRSAAIRDKPDRRCLRAVFHRHTMMVSAFTGEDFVLLKCTLLTISPPERKLSLLSLHSIGPIGTCTLAISSASHPRELKNPMRRLLLVGVGHFKNRINLIRIHANSMMIHNVPQGP